MTIYLDRPRSRKVGRRTVSVAQGRPRGTVHRSKGNVGNAFFAECRMSDDAAFLREQARRCRRLARGIATPDVAATLEGMALDYDARADEMEKRSR
jgi:aminoglycoside phosphotransferase